MRSDGRRSQLRQRFVLLEARVLRQCERVLRYGLSVRVRHVCIAEQEPYADAFSGLVSVAIAVNRRASVRSDGR